MIINGKEYGKDWFHDEDPPRFIRREGVTTQDLYEIFDDNFKEKVTARTKGIYVFYNRKGEVLYTGSTTRAKDRFVEHAKYKGWFPEIHEIHIYLIDKIDESKALKILEELMRRNLNPIYSKRSSHREDQTDILVIKKRGVRGNRMKRRYLVMIDSNYVRDVQIASTPKAVYDSLSDDWLDMSGRDLSLGSYEATNTDEAVKMASEENNVPLEALTAHELNDTERTPLEKAVAAEIEHVVVDEETDYTFEEKMYISNNIKDIAHTIANNLQEFSTEVKDEMNQYLNEDKRYVLVK